MLSSSLNSKPPLMVNRSRCSEYTGRLLVVLLLQFTYAAPRPGSIVHSYANDSYML